MRTCLRLVAAFGLSLFAVACTDNVADTAPDSDGARYSGTFLIPGPEEPGFDADLAAKARRYERLWWAVSAWANGANTEVHVALDRTEDRALIERFVSEHDGWDFEAFAGKSPADAVNGWSKVAGLYGGVGIAASAFRYGALRDQGYPDAEVDEARTHVLAGIEAFHIASTMPGIPGVIARGYARYDIPLYDTREVLPLFDPVTGDALPLEKNNGEFRLDQSGEYPQFTWEDSCSRDQMLGWATAAPAVWEVIRDDPTFDADIKAQLQTDAREAGRQLMIVRDNGYDLEIYDGDGRRTLHGFLNENAVDRIYFDGARNGFHAIMALAFVAAWAYVSEDPELERYLYEDLLRDRRLHEIARDSMMLVSIGVGSNFSNYNMAFGSAWVAHRYIDDLEARTALADSTLNQLYAIPGASRQPIEMGQSLFDFIYAATDADLTPTKGASSPDAVDAAAMARGTKTLQDFPEPPYWNFEISNCPQSSCTCEQKAVDVRTCTAPDGVDFEVLGCIGWKCRMVTDKPIGMHLLGPSNYHWRSDPYEPNRTGDGAWLFPGVDFRIAYWSARWARTAF